MGGCAEVSCRNSEARPVILTNLLVKEPSELLEPYDEVEAMVPHLLIPNRRGDFAIAVG
jgi:hypothetical protein